MKVTLARRQRTIKFLSFKKREVQFRSAALGWQQLDKFIIHPTKTEAYLTFFKELREIGRKEGFSVQAIIDGTLTENSSPYFISHENENKLISWNSIQYYSRGWAQNDFKFLPNREIGIFSNTSPDTKREILTAFRDFKHRYDWLNKRRW